MRAQVGPQSRSEAGTTYPAGDRDWIEPNVLLNLLKPGEKTKLEGWFDPDQLMYMHQHPNPYMMDDQGRVVAEQPGDMAKYFPPFPDVQTGYPKKAPFPPPSAEDKYLLPPPVTAGPSAPEEPATFDQRFQKFAPGKFPNMDELLQWSLADHAKNFDPDNPGTYPWTNSETFEEK